MSSTDRSLRGLSIGATISQDRKSFERVGVLVYNTLYSCTGSPLYHAFGAEKYVSSYRVDGLRVPNTELDRNYNVNTKAHCHRL